jgi:hypothetical protein
MFPMDYDDEPIHEWRKRQLTEQSGIGWRPTTFQAFVPWGLLSGGIFLVFLIDIPTSTRWLGIAVVILLGLYVDKYFEVHNRLLALGWWIEVLDKQMSELQERQE